MAAERWEVPGYVVGRLLGYGELGEVWAARTVGTGEPVVLRRMVGFAPADVAAVISPLPSLPAESVVRLIDVQEVDDDAVLVMEHAAGGSLAALSTRLSKGQVVTAIAPIAQAVAAAHELGLRHGRITASEVLLTEEGRPLLDGLGLRSLLADEGDDLEDLLLLARSLDGDGALTDVLTQSWTDPSALAAALLKQCPAEPLLTAAGPTSAPAGPRPVMGLLVAAVLVLVSSVLVASRLDQPPSRPSSRPSWTAVLAALDQSRAEAFATSDPGVLAQVYATGSENLLADTRRLRRLTSMHQRAEGLVHRIVSLRAEESPGRVVLQVQEGLVAFALIGPGPQRRQVVEGPVRSQQVVLVQTARGWRISVIST